jgi:hypothetical protein
MGLAGLGCGSASWCGEADMYQTPLRVSDTKDNLTQHLVVVNPFVNFFSK